MTSDRVLDLLRDARWILGVPERWTGSKHEAADECGRPVDPTDPQARSFAIRGALLRSVVERGYLDARGRLDRMALHEACGWLAPRTEYQLAQTAVALIERRCKHDAVVAWLDRTIEQRERGENPRVQVQPRRLRDPLRESFEVAKASGGASK